MAPEAWEKRLCNLIKKYKSSSDVAAFRNEYRDVVRLARDKGRADVSLLLEIRDILESWASATPPVSEIAYRQWEKVYRAGELAVPGPVQECLLRRFPQASAAEVDWNPFVLSCTDAGLIYVLLDRRLIRDQDLNHLAQTRPSEFYRSAVLDVMVERAALHDVRPIWEEGIRGTARPFGLMTRDEVLVHCYARSPGEKENDQMLSFLLASPPDREKLLGLLLKEHEAAIRLCRYLTFGRPTIGMRSPEWVATHTHDLLGTWISRCGARLEAGTTPETKTASLVLSLIRLSLLAEAGSSGGGKPAALNDLAAQTTRTAVLRMLQKGEDERSSGKPDVALVVLNKELYQGVQDYLKRLPIGTDSGQESSERARRFARHVASKQVIEQVLLAMAETPDDTGLRDALEVALFNCGVHQLGEVGEQMRFDVRIHEAESAGVLPEDLVVVTQPGRYLGEKEEGFVIVKARVRPN